MQIIERCTHGKRTIGECSGCKKIYAKREHANTPKYLWTAARSRARHKGLPFTIAVSDVIVPTHCPVLGIALDSSDRDHAPSLDEVVQGLGYVGRNVCVISGRANRIKSDATPAELMAVQRYAHLRGLFAVNGVPESW